MMELEGVIGELDGVRKAKVGKQLLSKYYLTYETIQNSAESKLESLDSQVHRLKSLNDDMQRQVNDLNASKAKLSSENYELTIVIQEHDSQIINLRKFKSSLEIQVDDLKKSLDEETRVSSK